MTNTNATGRRTDHDPQVSDHLPPPRKASLAVVGIFVILGTVATLTVLFTMTEPATFRGRHTLYTLIEDAGGVRRGDPVLMRGVNIGRVHSFNLREDGLVHVNLEVERRWPIPVGSQVELGSPELFGGRTMLVLPGPGPGTHEDGDLLPVVEGGDGGILGSVEDMADNATDFLDRMNAMLDTGTVASVQSGVREFETFLTATGESFETTSSVIAAMAASVQAAADSAAAIGSAVTPGIESVLAQADTAIATLDEAVASIDGTLSVLRSILEKIDSGEGTLGMLVNDPELYDNANATLVSVTELLADFRENPKKYIDVSIF